MSERGYKTIKNSLKVSNSKIGVELSEALVTIEEYSKAVEIIIRRLEYRKRVNTEFLKEIENFISHAKKQLGNNNLDKKIRIKYIDLIKEEESLHGKIYEDLRRNDELIKSIKESMDALD